MCGMALSLLSTAIGAIGQMQQAQAEADAANYRAEVDEINAKTAEWRARDAIVRGKAEQRRVQLHNAELKGRQRAAQAANGVDITFGSALDAGVDTAMLGELDVLTTRANSYREAFDHKVDAVNHRNSAELNRMQARNAKKGGFLSGAGTILSGIGKAYGSYQNSTGLA